MALGAWVRTRRVNVLKREKPRLCAVSLLDRIPRYERGEGSSILPRRAIG